MDDMAVVDVVWVGEKNPDRFSRMIQWILRTNYSHNALIFHKTGMVWHATTGDPKAEGVCEQAPAEAFKGCVVRYRKTVRLSVTNAYFEGWLEGERGKPYSHRQNIGAISRLWKFLYQNGDQARNCSEFVARALRWSPYKFPVNADYITPVNTFKVIKPEPCGLEYL